MKTLLTVLVLLLSYAQCGAELVSFPSKAGEYSEKEWRYVYEIKSKGTRSEKRIGRLFKNGEEIKGKIGDIHQKPIGRFVYFGERGYNQGWLNTMTYDQPVFAKDGTLTKKVSESIKSSSNQKLKDQ